MESSVCGSCTYAYSPVLRRRRPLSFSKAKPLFFQARLPPAATVLPPKRKSSLISSSSAIDSPCSADGEAERGVMNNEEDDWMNELEKLSLSDNKCVEERKGAVELLECLEKEAIMGEDEGRDPIDYNRRALIFDHSSRVFQALKDRTAATGAPQQS